VLISAKDCCVFTKRNIRQKTPISSYDQQHPCEKECYQPKLSARVQNEKKSDSTICEEEFHQQKLSESST
jgi:hypothetical protein